MSESNPAGAPSIAHALMIALNTLRVHELSNEASRRAIGTLLEGVHYAFLEEGACELRKRGEQVFVNGNRVKRSSEVADVVSLLDRLAIGGIAFASPPEPDALAAFVVNLARHGVWQAPPSCYVEALPETIEDSTGDGKEIGRTERVYRHAISEIRGVFRHASERNEVSVRRARRVSGDVIETLVRDESVIFGLMAIRDHDVYTFQHCVNVCVLSSALGSRVGFDRVTLRELGVAALLHDIGKLGIPRHILAKPGNLTRQEWDVMRSHPVIGARMLMTERALDSGLVKVMKVALEHHIRFDGTGYPRLTFAPPPGLFSFIVGLCDCYDAMTSVRVYCQSPILPAHAISFIWSKRGEWFHPVLVKKFIRLLGAYPPGSLLKLSDERVAVSVAGPTSSDVYRPVVRLWGGPETIDLAQTPALRVVACLDPTALDLSDADVQRHILSH